MRGNEPEQSVNRMKSSQTVESKKGEPAQCVRCFAGGKQGGKRRRGVVDRSGGEACGGNVIPSVSEWPNGSGMILVPSVSRNWHSTGGESQGIGHQSSAGNSMVSIISAVGAGRSLCFIRNACSTI